MSHIIRMAAALLAVTAIAAAAQDAGTDPDASVDPDAADYDTSLEPDVIVARSALASDPNWHGCTHSEWGQTVEGVSTEFTHVLVPGSAIANLGIQTGATCQVIAADYLSARSQICGGGVQIGDPGLPAVWSVYVPESSRLVALICG